jgi:hypothetical protein
MNEKISVFLAWIEVIRYYIQLFFNYFLLLKMPTRVCDVFLIAVYVLERDSKLKLHMAEIRAFQEGTKIF